MKQNIGQLDVTVDNGLVVQVAQRCASIVTHNRVSVANK
jgi:hypothetical protein